MRILIWVISLSNLFCITATCKKKNCEYLSNPFFCRWDYHHSATWSFSIIPLQQKQNAEEITCRFTFQVSKHEIVRGPRKTRTKMIRNKIKRISGNTQLQNKTSSQKMHLSYEDSTHFPTPQFLSFSLGFQARKKPFRCK